MIGGKYVTEYRHHFPGGCCTAYLLARPDGFYVHTITRMDSGCWLQTPGRPAASDWVHDLRTTAESVPLS